MADLFLSYASEDEDRARKVADALSEHGWSVFWDRTIPAGQTWRNVIGAELKAARAVVVLWSEISIKKHWVIEEADRALRKKNLIPVLIDNVEQPLGFGSVQAAELIGWTGSPNAMKFEKLLQDMDRLLGTQKATASVSPPRRAASVRETDTADSVRPSPDNQNSSQRQPFLKRYAVLLILGLFCLAGAGWFISQSGDNPKQLQIETLLRKAEEAMTEKRFTNPRGKSAYDHYQDILSLDPQNKTAKAGLKRILQHHIGQARAALGRDALDEAESYLTIAVELFPESIEANEALAQVEIEKSTRKKDAQRQAEAARKAELEKQQAEAAKKAELQKQREEAARQAQRDRLRTEAISERQRGTSTPSETGRTVLLGTWSWDIEGNAFDAGKSADVWWQQVSIVERYLNPQNGAQLSILKNVDYKDVHLDTLRRANYGSNKLSGSDRHPLLSYGTIIGIKTAEGNYAKVKVLRYRSTHDFSFKEAKHLTSNWRRIMKNRPVVKNYHLEIQWTLFRLR